MYEKFLEKYRILKHEKEEISQKYIKFSQEQSSILLKEQEKYECYQKENLKLQKIIKELRNDNKNLQNKLNLKDLEIKELQSRFETKTITEEKRKDRDLMIFAKVTGRKPIPVANSQDSKLLSMISTYETQKDRLEKKIEELNMKNINKNENEFEFCEKQDKNKIFEQLSEKISILNSEKMRLENENYIVSENLNRLQNDYNELCNKNNELCNLFEKIRNENVLLYERMKNMKNNYQLNSSRDENKENKIGLSNLYISEDKNKKDYSELVEVKIKKFNYHKY